MHAAGGRSRHIDACRLLRSGAPSAEPAEANGPTLPGVRVFDVADPAGPREITSPIAQLRNRKAVPDDAAES